MKRWASLTAALALAVGCGRVGYDLATAEGTPLGSDASIGTGGAGGATDGAVNPGSGGSGPKDGAVTPSSGGATASGGSGGATASGGSGGTTASTGGVDGGPGTGGLPSTGGASAGGAGGSGGSDAGSYTCTPGARELCDGRDNNCDNVVDEAPACPSQCGGTAWGNHGYMLCDDTNNGWSQAKTKCESAGLHLVRIDSKAENDFLWGLAFAQRNRDVWIGGSDLATEGDWRWPDGTQFWSGIAGDGGVAIGGAYTHWWTPGEPNNLNGASDGDGDCLAMSQIQGYWLDEGCNFFNRFLCETP